MVAVSVALAHKMCFGFRQI